MRKSVVPQTGHCPFMACLPFFMVMLCGSFISLFVLHFTQYATVVSVHLLSERSFSL
jgi:hypothetical protein